MLKDQLAVYELLRDIIKGKTGPISKVTYIPQKPAFPEGEIEQLFPRSTPESQGISSEYLASFVREVAEKKETDIHNIMILRNSCVIGEFSFAPFQREIWHISHSMCKSITGMAIGLLISEGKLQLDDKVIKILSKKSLLGSIFQKNVTVEHLLTMTSLVTFNEMGIVSGDDWVKEYLGSSVDGTPGEKFEYNSMNSYILSAIVTEITGQSMFEYLKSRIFEPMGIKKIFWESCPEGITKGGWGLFMCQEDAAKLGQLYLQKGGWKGQQLVPEQWITASLKKHADTPPEMGSYGYGYQIWLSGRPGSFDFNGMLGQNVIGYPDINMLIVTNAGSDELFQNSELMKVIQKYFEGDYMPEEQLPSNPVGEMYLSSVQKRMMINRDVPAAILRGGWKKGNRRNTGKRQEGLPEKIFKGLDSRMYQLQVKQAGIFPLIMQVFHNNFTDGIERIGFLWNEDKPFLVLKEGEDNLELEIGFQKAAVTEITIHGEPYLTAVKGTFARNEYGKQVLLLEIAYLEEAARRKLKVVFENEEEIKVEFDETPGKKMIQEGLGGVLQAAAGNTKFASIIGLDHSELPEMVISRTINPVFRGSLVREQRKETR